MLYDSDQTLAHFLNAAAAKQPTPGGGAVAALAGALAASMGEMAVNYSVNRASLAAHKPVLEDALHRLTRARAVLTELMLEDQAAFETFSEAKKAGKPADELTQLAAACVAVPQAVAATAVAVLELAGSIAGKVNPFLLSDLSVCCELAMATVRCARHNVRANLSDLPSDAAQTAEREIDAMLAHALQLIRLANAAVAGR